VTQERAKQIKISIEWKKEQQNKNQNKKNLKYIFIVHTSSLLWRRVGFL
jgi:hypothetical protein